MNIVSNVVEQRNDYQFVYFTLTDDLAVDYQWHGNVPLGEVVDDWLTANMDKIWKLILGKRYPEARKAGPFDTVADMEQWIIDNTPTEVPWVSTHPNVFPATGTEASMLLTAIKDLVNAITYDQIDTHIDNTFTSLTAGERASLKKVYKAVLYLAKKR